MGKKSSKAPDVKGAAETEGEFSREAARDQLYANRPDQYNPFGSNTWQQQMVIDPATGEETTKWTQRTNLSKDMQQLKDQDMYRNIRLGGMSGAMSDRINQEMGQPLDWAQFGDVERMDFDPTAMRQASEDAAYQRSANRLDPQFEQQRKDLEIRLRNRGLSAGDQQYQSEMDSFATGRNDAYEQARLGATSEGRAEAAQGWDQAMSGNERANALRQQQINEYLAKRGQSLSESNALKQSQNVGEMTTNYGGGA